MYASGDVSLYLYAVREPVLSIGDVRLTATTQCIHCSTSAGVLTDVVEATVTSCPHTVGAAAHGVALCYA